MQGGIRNMNSEQPICKQRPERRAQNVVHTRMTLAESVLDNLNEVVFQTDKSGTWVFLNPAWEELTGFAVTDTLGRSFLDYIHPDDRQSNHELILPLIERKKNYCHHEIRYLHRDQGFRWVEVFARLTLSEDGQVTGIAGTLTDITKRKAAEEKLRLAASVFMHAGEGIMITSSEGIIVDVNAAFETITGYSRAEVLGRNPNLLNSGKQEQSFYTDMWRSLEADDYWQGEVWNRRKSGEFYVERLTITAIRDAKGETSNYVGIFSDITMQKLQAQHLEQMAHYDPLTGLPNRRLLADRLQQSMARARRNGQRVAVVYLDLDGFKAVNDEHGHECGDGLLIAVGNRMKQAVREFDTVCRLGGDEFVAVIGDLKCAEDCLPMIARLLDSVSQPVVVDGTSLRVTGSLGISFYPQDEEIDADQLMRQADQAMYLAKERGKNRYCIFDNAQHRSTLDRNELLEEIERAIRNREFVLHYQPIVDLKTGQLAAVEALIRWMHPQRGCLAPAEFLPVIEGHPLAIPLEDWVMNEALDQHERWLDMGRDIAVSVNMSSTQLHQRDFVKRLRSMLRSRPRVNPDRLKLEVLETSALEDIEHVSKTISECAEIGVSFSLDDFGTGYSSLLYLKQLPARTIKIDQSFVKNMLEDPDDLAILEGVIGMAAAFKRDVIAEGVESVEHARMLVQLGCVMAQGFGIARPMPGKELVQWAGAWTLPPALLGCATLGREDALLLGAVVEYRAWSSALLKHVNDAAPARPALDLEDFRLDQWLRTAGTDPARCSGMVRDVRILREALHASAAALLQSHDDAGSHDLLPLVRRFEETTRGFLRLLSALMEGRTTPARRTGL